MCGIAGFARPGGVAAGPARRTLAAMAGAAAHRGPDGEGLFLDADAGAALGHRRLAVLDLTPSGDQPMASHSGRFVIAFNGEIYNHLDLRAAVERSGAVAWRGRSDTESLLAAIERFGVPAALERAAGMFAFALYDRAERRLLLARDRMGEKPLYYGRAGDSLLFASDLASFEAHPGFRGGIDPAAVARYLRHGFVPAPHSIYRSAWKLPAGHLLELPLSRPFSTLPSPRAWWSLAACAAAGLADPFPGDGREAADELERLLARAVARQRVADVPLGAFLSGGVDSSTVVALLRAGGARTRTFTVGFREAAYDESTHARAVAAHLGTAHTELLVTPREALDAVAELPRLYREPFGDASALPALLVSRLARRSVTVALSGDGGDELFLGYARYARTLALHRRIARLPRPLARALSPLARRLARPAFDRLAAPFARGAERLPLSDRARVLAGLLAAEDFDAFYHAKFRLLPEPAAAVRGLARDPSAPVRTRILPEGASPLTRMALSDALLYLPDDILAKVDRAAMSASLETRVPLLDPEVVAFAWRVPAHLHYVDGKGKRILRAVLARHVPPALTERPKRGFALPVGPWLRGELRDWADDLLSPAALADGDLLDAAPLRARWLAHRDGRADHQETLWPLLMLQAWRRERQRAAPSRHSDFIS